MRSPRSASPRTPWRPAGFTRTGSIPWTRGSPAGPAAPIEEVRRETWSRIPVGRYGRLEEFGQVVAFLASEAASYITGSAIHVDGGMTLSL